jgi:hypothetical protein
MLSRVKKVEENGYVRMRTTYRGYRAALCTYVRNWFRACFKRYFSEKTNLFSKTTSSCFQISVFTFSVFFSFC